MGISVSERQIQLGIIHYLKAIGATVGKTKIVGVGIGKSGARFKDPYVFRGFPDLTVFYKGRLFFIEVKSKSGRLSIHQKAFQKECHKASILYIVAFSVDDVEKEIKKIDTKLSQ